jgi:hypothetical protein
MNVAEHTGKALMIIGVIVVALGAVLYISGKVPFIGRLPGDILIRRRNFTFYFPLATSVLVSMIITLLFWLFGRGR